MELQKRYTFEVAAVIKGEDEPLSRSMQTTFQIALKSRHHVSIADGIQTYVDQVWSNKPHTVEVVTSIRHTGEIWVDVA